MKKGSEAKIRQESLIAEARALKAEGLTREEVAERIGKSLGWVQKYCKGIAPQKAKAIPWSKKEALEGQTERCRRMVEERLPEFDLVNYHPGKEDSDWRADLRCRKCGTIISRAGVTIRHGAVACDNCKRIEIECRRAEEQAEKERKRDAEQFERRERALIRMFLFDSEQLQMKTCVVCHKLFVPDFSRQVTCSPECSHKRANRSGWDRRYNKIRFLPMDDGITVDALFERDGGICYLCGKPCDKEDVIISPNGAIICGDNYPSRDHVKPISKGGTHTWDNVRLAHRRCNSLKSDGPLRLFV